ncbi:MAG TPA: POTRA domain-containing protein [Terriglobales bacterium]|nr:POTRA domain-containing protein [Terriglobales bacterium]
MSAGLRIIAFLLSAGGVLPSFLPIQAQTEPSAPCSRLYRKGLRQVGQINGSNIPTLIVSVNFEGDIHLPVPVQEQIATSLEQGAWSSDTNLNELSKEVGDYVRMKWQQNGYFKMEVKKTEASMPTSSAAEQAVAVNVDVKEGPLYRLGGISFRNATRFPQDQLRALFRFQPGDIFNTEEVRVGLDALRKLYGSAGYINFTSVPDTQIDEANHRVSLVIDVDQGKQFRVGHLVIIGLDQSLAATLRQKWPLKPGGVYNTSSVIGFLKAEEEFVKENASLFPRSANLTDNTVREIDEQNGIITPTLDFRPCQ